MIVSGVTRDQIEAVVEELNTDGGYAGNIMIERLEPLNQRGTRHTLKLRTRDSRAHGSRYSWSGRRVPALCFHGFRDVIRAIMAANPDAVVRTAMATYHGADGFEEEYTSVAGHNVGSLAAPAYMPDLCVGWCAGEWE